ncbi:chromosome partitioning protein ParA, partial [Pseudomonadota bacterium]
MNKFLLAYGHHHYDFYFVFEKKPYYFSRSTDASNVVNICDKNYTKVQEIPLKDYCKMLKEFYGLEGLESSFRSIVSPFSRIWKKGGLEPDLPFSSTTSESFGASISRLIELFNYSSKIAAEKKAIDDQKGRRKLLSDSMKAQIIPSIKKAQYNENINIISENKGKIEELKQGFTGALNAYEALFDENLRQLQKRKNELVLQKDELQIKIERLQNEISGITPRLSANISLVSEYFPSVDVKRLEQVEAFHQKIGGAVKRELKTEYSAAQDEQSALSVEIKSLENDIQSALTSKGAPDDLFKRIYELKEVTDKALEEN